MILQAGNEIFLDISATWFALGLFCFESFCKLFPSKDWLRGGGIGLGRPEWIKDQNTLSCSDDTEFILGPNVWNNKLIIVTIKKYQNYIKRLDYRVNWILLLVE